MPSGSARIAGSFVEPSADVLDLAVRPQHAALRGDLLDLGLAEADSASRSAAAGALWRRRPRFAPGTARAKATLNSCVGHAVLCEQFVGREVAARRVVLVQAMDGDAIGAACRPPWPATSRNASYPPLPMPTQSRRTKHDRLALGKQDDAAGRERIVDRPRRLARAHRTAASRAAA